MSFFTENIWIFYLLNLITILAIVCFQRRNPVASMAWILCFMLFPFVGSVIFLIFGVGIKTYTRHKYSRKLEMNEKYMIEEQKEVIKNLDSPDSYSGIINYFLNRNILCTRADKVDIFTKADEKYEALFADIAKAKKSIDILYFIIRNDTVGNRLIDALIEKARQGVCVRLMYDGFGSILTPRRMFDRLRKIEGAQVVEFFPVRIFSLSKINHRNHRKIVVIDDEIAYIGGMNVGDEYMNKAKKRNLHWRDTHMRFTGEAVDFVKRCFAMDWEFSTGTEIEIKERKPEEGEKENGVLMQIVPSGPDSRAEEIKCGMIKMINAASDYVYIQTPYFVPDQSFLTAVELAAESGVDVRVMIPGTPDKRYVYHTTMSYMGELLDAGVKVYLYPGFIHSKTITVDDRVCTIGSANTDIRSFQLLFELNGFLYSEEKAIESAQIFKKDMEISRELTMAEYKGRGVLKMVLEGFFRLFSPIM